MPRNDGKPWSDTDERLLHQLYPNDSNATLGKIFGRRPRNVQQKALALGLRKSEAYMATGPGQFPPGNQPWCKGLTGLKLGSEDTHFKKGQKSHNWVPLGSERLAKDGYRQRKVTDTGYPPRDWRMVHHLVWEEHNGRPVPEGHIVAFRDGDKANVTPENLMCITTAENMRRNSIHRLPPELSDLCRLRGSLTRKINRRARS
ncbi:HNH endonuclease signature motif containing protein [Halomonas borealis]|uniref:HNH endonuclease signature motif containing protein n=1 Tax=Halomonas borealis TaxID=2508710 RepID=UPI00109F7B62|nr:HNH endonuclease signature motif containing protein [Halomonas borealis]